MSIGIQNRPWGGQKPPRGTPLNLSDPITKGLRYAFLMNEGAGKGVYNSVPGINGGAYGKTTVTPGFAWENNCIHTGVTSTSFPRIGTDAALNSSPLSIHMRVFTAGTLIAQYNTFAGDCDLSGNDLNFTIYLSATKRFQMAWNNTVIYVGNSASQGPVVALKTWYDFVFVRDGGTGSWSVAFYLRDINNWSGMTNPYTTQYSSVNPLTGNSIGIGGAGLSVNNAPNLIIDCCEIWTRALQPLEVNRLFNDHYSMYLPRKRYFNVPLTATQTQSSIAKLSATTTKAQTSVGRLQSTGTRAQTGVGRLQQTAANSETSIARLAITTSRIQAGVGRVRVTATQAQPGAGRLQTTAAAKTGTSIAKLSATTYRWRWHVKQNNIHHVPTTPDR